MKTSKELCMNKLTRFSQTKRGSSRRQGRILFIRLFLDHFPSVGVELSQPITKEEVQSDEDVPVGVDKDDRRLDQRILQLLRLQKMSSFSE